MNLCVLLMETRKCCAIILSYHIKGSNEILHSVNWILIFNHFGPELFLSEILILARTERWKTSYVMGNLNQQHIYIVGSTFRFLQHCMFHWTCCNLQLLTCRGYWRLCCACYTETLCWTVCLCAAIETATKALNLVNGYDFKGKPIIIEFGKRSTTTVAEQDHDHPVTTDSLSNSVMTVLEHSW